MSTFIAGWLAFIVASATPGPSTLAIAALGMGAGRAAAMRFAAGVVVASQIWGALALLGFAAIMETYAGVALALKLACAGYLAYLAVRAWQRSVVPAGGTKALQPRHPFRSALMLHLTNPKAVLGWLAVIVIGVPSGDPAAGVPFVLGCAVLAIMVNFGYALGFSTPAISRAYAKARQRIERVVSVGFGAAAFGLAAEALRR